MGAPELRSEIVSQQANWMFWRALDGSQHCPASLSCMTRGSRVYLLSGTQPYLCLLEGWQCMSCKDCDYHDCKEKRRTYFHLCFSTFSAWFIEKWILKLKKVLEVIWREPSNMERGQNLIFMFEFQHCLLVDVCERTRISHLTCVSKSTSENKKWSD